MYILDISLYICVVIKKFTQTNQNKRNGKTLFLNMFISFLMHDIRGTLSAAETNYNVLFIQSYTNSSSWHNNLIAGLQDGLEEGGVKANVVIEYLNADFWTFASECVIMRRICERARQRKTDLVVHVQR